MMPLLSGKGVTTHTRRSLIPTSGRLERLAWSIISGVTSSRKVASEG